jgi:hypothetical protein
VNQFGQLLPVRLQLHEFRWQGLDRCDFRFKPLDRLGLARTTTYSCKNLLPLFPQGNINPVQKTRKARVFK